MKCTHYDNVSSIRLVGFVGFVGFGGEGVKYTVAGVRGCHVTAWRVGLGQLETGQLPPPRTTLLKHRNPGGLRFIVFDFQSPELHDIEQHSSRFTLRPLPPDNSPPLAMDFSKLQDQVSNLTLYDLKAGVRKVQNGTL